MKFNFKIQQYQTDAVDAVVKVFQGQGYHDRISYIRDVGKRQANQQMRLNIGMDQQYSLDTGENHQLNIYDLDNDDTGYKNEAVELTDDQLRKTSASRKASLVSQEIGDTGSGKDKSVARSEYRNHDSNRYNTSAHIPEQRNGHRGCRR